MKKMILYIFDTIMYAFYTLKYFFNSFTRTNETFLGIERQ